MNERLTEGEIKLLLDTHEWGCKQDGHCDCREQMAAKIHEMSKEAEC